MKKTAAVLFFAAVFAIFSGCSFQEPPLPNSTAETLSTVIIEQTYTLSEANQATAAPETTTPPKMSDEETAEQILLPPWGNVPEGTVMPTVNGNEPRRATLFCQLDTAEYFVIYEVSADENSVISELCYTPNGGQTWERLRFNKGTIRQFQAIDREHFIIIAETDNLGISFYLYENGKDIAQTGTSVWSMLSEEEFYEYDYLFNRSRFATGDVTLNDGAYFNALGYFSAQKTDEGTYLLTCHYYLNNEHFGGTAIYDVNGIHPEP